MRFRGKSIRRKIVALLLVPLVSLTALWGFATVLTGREASRAARRVAPSWRRSAIPPRTPSRVIQQERRQTLVYLADPRASDALPALRRAARRHRRGRRQDHGDIRAEADVRDDMRLRQPSALNAVLEAFDGLGALRRTVEERHRHPHPGAGVSTTASSTPATASCCRSTRVDNVEMDKQGRALVGISRARETALPRGRADRLRARRAASSRRDELRAISDLVAKRKLLYEINLAVLPAGGARSVYEQYWNERRRPRRCARPRTGLIAAGPATRPGRVDAEALGGRGRAPSSTNSADDSTTQATDRYQDRVEPVGDERPRQGRRRRRPRLPRPARLASFVSVRIGREPRPRPVPAAQGGPRGLRRAAAQRDAPPRRGRAGRRRDRGPAPGVRARTRSARSARPSTPSSAPPSRPPSSRPNCARGVSEVFVNLARRSQVLLHRQLTLLDTMERRTEDTDELADLFRLDHLTTRMRRHAEGLVILSGAAPSRQWRKPVQLMDVVRAAVAEVEDYERIEVRRLPRIGRRRPGRRRPHPPDRRTPRERHGVLARRTPPSRCSASGSPTASPWRSTTAASAWRPRRCWTPTCGSPRPPSSTSPTPTGSACSWSAGSPSGRTSGSPCSPRRTAAPPRSSSSPAPCSPTTSRTPTAPASASTARARVRPDGAAVTASSRRSPRSPPVSAAPRCSTDPSNWRRPSARWASTTGRCSAVSTPARCRRDSGVGDIEDTESERGGIFRARARDRRRQAPDEQHQQALDQTPERLPGPVPLPRRKPPTLVTDHGRRVDERGRTHPAPGARAGPADEPALAPAPEPRPEPRAEPRHAPWPAPAPAAPAPAPAPAPRGVFMSEKDGVRRSNF